MSHAEPTPIEALLAHGGWVRELAIRLVRDEAEADDLVQDTWAAALRSPPRRRGGVRAWLATVLRNRHRERFRAASRREARESAVARPDRTPAADEIVSRADAHRHVVTTVLTLDEPYRSTVLLLFFESLTPNEVAARLGVPVDTVRTRARRALEVLRARLDRDHGGDRRAWAVAVLGLDAWTRWGGATAGVSSTVLGALGTGVVMATTTTTVIAAVGGIAAGVVLTLLASGDSPVPPAQPGAPGSVASSAAADTARAQPGGTNGASGRRDRPGPADSEGETSATAVSVTGTHDPEFERTLPALATGRIHGRVLLADGSPVPGVTVRGSVRRSVARVAPEAGAPRRPTEEELVADARHRARWEAATTFEAVTDADGRYELTQVRQAEHTMRAWGAGMQVRPAPGRRTSTASPGDSFDFVAIVKVPVRVLVVDSAGESPAEARLNWRPSGERGGGFGARWTPSDQIVHAEVGTWDVTAEIRGEDTVRSDPVTVTVMVGSEPSPVELRLRGEPGIRGRVTVPASQRWSSVDIYAVRQPGREATDEELRRGERASARAPDYTYQLRRIEPGTYTVAMATGDGADYVRKTVVVGEGVQTCDFEMPVVAGDRVLSLRVAGPDGKPVEDVAFGLEIRDGTSFGALGSSSGHLQEDGSWLYPVWGVNQANWDTPGAEWTLVVDSKTLGRQRVPFVRGRDARLDITFQQPTSVNVAALGYVPGIHDGRLTAAIVPVGGASSPVTAGSAQPAALDGDGRLTVHPVVPGRYEVQLFLTFDRMRRIQVAAQRVIAGSDPVQVSLNLPALLDVTVRAPDFEPGDQLELTGARAPRTMGFSVVGKLDESRTATWDALPAGSYVLAGMVGDERREMRIDVTSAGTFDFVPGLLDGMEISIEHSDGRLARAGFQSGDVLIAVDDVEFETTWHARTALSRVREKKSVQYRVLRGGRESVVEGPPDVFAGAAHAGGTWMPVQR